MITEVALITVSCVLFVQMGLADAILKAVRIKFSPCQKCLSFWTCFAWMLWSRHTVVLSVATSFIASYLALWLTLLYDALATLYNYFYEKLTKTDGASEVASSDRDAQADDDEVPQM